MEKNWVGKKLNLEIEITFEWRLKCKWRSDMKGADSTWWTSIPGRANIKDKMSRERIWNVWGHNKKATRKEEKWRSVILHLQLSNPKSSHHTVFPKTGTKTHLATNPNPKLSVAIWSLPLPAETLVFDYQMLLQAPMEMSVTNFTTYWPQDTWIRNSELITENEVRDIMRSDQVKACKPQ